MSSTAAWATGCNRRANGRKAPRIRTATRSSSTWTADEHLTAGQPVISVDTKKKELVGFKNEQPKGTPTAVLVHDFPTDAEGKAIPYVADTPAFAVASIPTGGSRWVAAPTPTPRPCSRPMRAGATGIACVEA